VLEDPRGTLTLEQAASPALAGRYRPHGTRSLELGLRSTACWVRLEPPAALAQATEHDQGRDWFLELGKGVVDQVDLHIPVSGPEPGWLTVLAGAERPRDPRQQNFRTMVFLLPSGLDAARPMYLRLQSRISLSMPVLLWAEHDFMSHANRDSLAFGFIFGVMSAMALFNLIIFLSLRDRTFVAYVCYVTTMLLAQLVLQGHLGNLLPRPLPLLAPAQTFLSLAALFFAGLFTRAFLETKTNAPRWDHALKFLLALALAGMVLALAGRLGLANALGYVVAFLAPMFALGAGIACHRRGYRPARFFLAAWSVLLAGSATFLAASLGLVPYGHWVPYVLPMGTALESLLLTLALSERISQVNRERHDLAKSQRRYQELSITDGLTGLFNPRYLQSKLSSEMEHARRLGQPLSLLMLDLDDFKSYNDAYGHLEGDRLLLGLARILRRCLRDGDSPCRYGGEEFTVVLPGSRQEEALKVAERVRKDMENLALGPRHAPQRPVTVSIGLAQLREGETPEEFLHRADLAMYKAKAQGKNCCRMAD
jgi:diguanylate cyclase (GGDEF)-like protein